MLNFMPIIIIPYLLGQAHTMKEFDGQSHTNPPPIIRPQYEPLQVANELFCPMRKHDQAVLYTLLPDNKNIQLTLIEASPSDFDQETRCMVEVQPIFGRRPDEMKKMEPWDVDKTYDIYVFYFQLWYYILSPSEYYDIVKNNDPLPTVDLIFSPVYDIIHDYFMRRVTMTRHKISSLENTSDYQTLQNQLINSVNELSTKSYHFDKEHFLMIINAFQSYNSKPTNPKMIKQNLVPEQHLAPVRNKAAKHVINIAPLWDELALLMTVINSAIQRVDIQIKYSSGPNDSESIYGLIIYTKLFYPKTNIPEVTSNKLNIPDVWCKFVHRRAKQSGILIYIHNTPHQPPQDADKYCKIEDRVNCNFDNWIENNNRGSIENVHYAYCCAPTAPILKEHFWMEDEIKSVLNIEEILAKGNTDIVDQSKSKRKPDDSSMENNHARKQQKSNPANPKMIKQKLVPEQDLASLQNKATKHIINIAPLWDELALLIAVINSAIQRANKEARG